MGLSDSQRAERRLEPDLEICNTDPAGQQPPLLEVRAHHCMGLLYPEDHTKEEMWSPGLASLEKKQSESAVGLKSVRWEIKMHL